MKFNRVARWALAVGGFLFPFSSWPADTKFIRLRNAQLETPPPFAAKATLATPAADRPVSGLYLIQFTAPLRPEWREQLAGLNTDLVSYIPDDAFIANLTGARLSQIWALGFVRWVGPFLSEYKVHLKLRGRVGGQLAGNAAEITLLLSPRADPQQTESVRRSLRQIQRETRYGFGTVLQGQVTLAAVGALAESQAVLWIEPAFRPKLNDEIASKIVGGEGSGHLTLTQELGYDGSGVTVAVADSGLHNGDAQTMHPDLFGRVTAFFHYGSLLDAADEHSHGTHVTGIIAGNGAAGEMDESDTLYGLGVAPGAHIVAQRLFDGVGGYEPPPTFETMTRDAVRAGADIGSNSWGDDTQGRYDTSAMEFDALVRDADALRPGDQPYILEFSAGNAGPGSQTIGSPAVAKNVIATGASQNNRLDFFIYTDGQDTMADFSSRGPCEDGRIKPDVVAPGTWIASLKSASATDENAWAPISDLYLYQGGTSQAGPHVSGAAAIFVQYYRERHGRTPSPALVKAALINSAADMDNEVETAPTPNMDEGWGRIDLTELILGPRGYDFVDQEATLTAGQSYERRLVLATSDEPLKITLAYTDPPGFPGAIPALVNDLDLEVVAPDGRTYRGNQFDQGESAPNAAGTDAINNVEAVHLAAPSPGEYIVRVRARNIAADARRETVLFDQDFALALSGDIPLPGVGVLFFDRAAYRAPAQILLKLIDADLAGLPSVNVLVRSTAEPAGETITLRASLPPAVFTGSVATVTGSPVSDGRLQVAHGNAIEARYQDALPAGTRLASARADLLPPVLSAVSATNRFGRTLISWQSDEPANSVVRYGTNASLLNSATNDFFTVQHEVSLDGLISGGGYFFAVISTDQAGNTTTNDNAGALHRFVAGRAATVLLVNAYVPDAESRNIPLTTYTSALDQTGVSYEVWDVTQRGSPQLGDLRPFQIVIWRVSDSIYSDSPHSTLSPAEQSALQSYLEGGGSFFMASMEILSRLGAVPFRSNVLQVAQFLPNQNIFEPCSDCDEDFGVPIIEGLAGDLVSSGVLMDLDYSAYPEIEFLGLGPDFSDTFTPSTNAAPIFLEWNSGKPCGMRLPRTGQDSTGRVVFLSFPLDTVPASGPAPNNRASLLHNVLSFLAPGVNGLGTIALDSLVYTAPGLATVEVADSDLTGMGETTVRFSSESDAMGRTVALRETVRPGLFRGAIALMPSGGAVAPGQLAVADGDTIRAEYFDASANAAVQAIAEVDTNSTLISSVAASPDYETAVVTWQTSELADSLVQFLDSTFPFPINRTKYDAALTFDHEVLLDGLVPDRDYFYQVVSRDGAGNVSVDDNGGRLYSFRTLRPVLPPWFDRLETGGTNWIVVDADGAQSTWTLGVPDNGLETEAFSPLNAWGSNRQGDAIDYSETFLISPAIDLRNGNRAMLRFWHSYDFTDRTGLDLLEGGQLLIITNSLQSPAFVTEFGEFSFGWEEEEIDLSAYSGRVVYLVWYYQLLSFETAPRPGWLVDDVALTLSNVAPGVIVISNNLAQSRFLLAGPITRTGQGHLTTITNAPPGEYVVEFGDVPYYLTPAATADNLASHARISFFGQYTIPDVNRNDMSDLWEQAYFHEVSPLRTRATDTDLDGATDYAEFIAGTDPTSAASLLRLVIPAVLPNGTLRLEWPSVPGRLYRVLGSLDGRVWSPVLAWFSAIGPTTIQTLPLPAPGEPYLFRVEVSP